MYGVSVHDVRMESSPVRTCPGGRAGSRFLFQPLCDQEGRRKVRGPGSRTSSRQRPQLTERAGQVIAQTARMRVSINKKCIFTDGQIGGYASLFEAARAVVIAVDTSGNQRDTSRRKYTIACEQIHVCTR